MPGVWQTENSVVSAIVTGSGNKVRKLADFHKVPHVFGYEQYAEMLIEDICDAVYVALPNSLHAEYTIQAAKACKHILCLLYTSPSPRDQRGSRMPSSA